MYKWRLFLEVNDNPQIFLNNLESLNSCYRCDKKAIMMWCVCMDVNTMPDLCYQSKLKSYIVCICTDVNARISHNDIVSLFDM